MKRKASGDQPASKRRRGPKGEGDDAGDPAAQQAAVKAYMFHASKLLVKAVKKARTFEVQKLVRKLKTTREPKDDTTPDSAVIASLEAQLAALKATPLDTLPTFILHSRLHKITCIAPFLSDLLASLPPAPPVMPEGPQLIARNRILASKSVHEAWDEVTRAVMKRMGEQVAPPAPPPLPASSSKSVPIVALEVNSASKDPDAPEKKLSKRAARAAAGAAKALLPKPGMDPGRKALLETLADEADSEDSDPNDEEENGSEDDDEEVMRELARLDDSASDGSFESDEALSDADEEEGIVAASALPPAATAPRKRKIASTSKPATSSAFLPSLAGGYISYSDSDGEDAKWVKEGEKDDKKERKNRRGQRARRAIWEQKYGSGAKHVVASQGGSLAPSKVKKPTTKRALRRAAEAAAASGSGPPVPFDPAAARDADKNPNAQPVAARKSTAAAATVVRSVPSTGGAAAPSGERVHPSWEAKKKATEAMLASMKSAGVGKKITFD